MRAAAPVAIVVLVACRNAQVGGPAAHIDGEGIDPVVVAHVAAQGGIDEASARARVVETLQLVAAARAERGDRDAAELDPERAAHLRRTTLARLVLHDEFEPEHRPVDIPADDPLLVRARAPGRFVHPLLFDVCQLIAMPKGVTAEAADALTADPLWRERATELMAPVARHVQEGLATGDPQACDLLARDLPLEQREADGIELRYERARFDLDACAEPLAADGSCASPRFAPAWVEAVREGAVPGWRGPFWTQFGLHLALVHGTLPANLPERAGFEDDLRASILHEWQAGELAKWLAALRIEYAAQTVVAGEDAPR